MISTQNIGVTIGKKTILNNISISLEPGKLTTVLGPNGAGKSTLLNCLSGDRKPTVGRVMWADKPLLEHGVEWLAQRRAVMSQGDNLAFPFKVEEVALFGRHPHNSGWADEQDRSIVSQALSATSADHLVGRIYPTCSGGERARVQFARSLAQIWQEPENDGGRVLLLDEPTAALDLAHQHACLALARSIANQGVAVLAVLHQLDLAAHYADAVLLLENGRQRAWGPSTDVLDPDLLTQVYGIDIVVTDGIPQVAKPAKV